MNLNRKDTSPSELEITPKILNFAREALVSVATKHGVDPNNLIAKLGLPILQAESDVDPTKESERKTNISRLAEMGWTDNPPTESEVARAIKIAQTVKGISRYGYQTTSYVLSKQEDGTFSGMVFPGYHSNILNINDIRPSLKSYQEQVGDNIKIDIDLDFSSNALDISGRESIEHLAAGNHGEIVVIQKFLRNPEGDVSVIGVPACDGGYSGHLPFSYKMGRYKKALQIIQFDTAENRLSFEQQLLESSNPLRTLNALYAVMFSPDSCTNLLGANSSRGIQEIILNGELSSSNGLNVSLKTLAGLGFNLQRSIEKGANRKPTTI